MDSVRSARRAAAGSPVFLAVVIALSSPQAVEGGLTITNGTFGTVSGNSLISGGGWYESTGTAPDPVDARFVESGLTVTGMSDGPGLYFGGFRLGPGSVPFLGYAYQSLGTRESGDVLLSFEADFGQRSTYGTNTAVFSVFAGAFPAAAEGVDIATAPGGPTLIATFTLDAAAQGLTAAADVTSRSLDTAVGTVNIGSLPVGTEIWLRIGEQRITASGSDLMIDNLSLTTSSSADPFGAWALAAGLTGEAGKENGKGDDPDGDGVSNLLEFALHGDPLDPADGGLRSVVIQDLAAPAGNELTMVVAVRSGAVFSSSGSSPNVVQAATIDGLTYRIEGSVDLATFPNADVSHVSGPSGTVPGMPEITGSGWEYHTFRLDVSEGLPDSGFLRVSVADASP